MCITCDKVNLKQAGGDVREVLLQHLCVKKYDCREEEESENEDEKCNEDN